LVYILLFAIIYLTIFYHHNGNFFDFQDGDTVYYHQQSILHVKDTLRDYIAYLRNYDAWDDMGVKLYAWSLYRIKEGPILVYFVNILLATITAKRIYDLSSLYLNNDESMVVSSLFALSSYFIYFQVSLFKESLFVLICVTTIYNLQLIIQNKSLSRIILLVFQLLILSIFRIGTPIIIVGSYALFSMYSVLKLKLKNILLLLILGVILYYTAYTIFLKEYMMFFDIEFLSYYVDASGYGYSYPVQSIISIFSSLFGPIPAFIALKGNELSSFYYSGYLIKFLLAPYFILAVYFIFRNKYQEVYPLVIYYLVGSLIFGIALRGFDMRFLATHSFVYYLIVFIGACNYKLLFRDHKLYFIASYIALGVVFFAFNSRI
jgi:hypothetical protein